MTLLDSTRVADSGSSEEPERFVPVLCWIVEL